MKDCEMTYKSKQISLHSKKVKGHRCGHNMHFKGTTRVHLSSVLRSGFF